jgi:hypothetical protein
MDIRENLRDRFQKETGLDPTKNLATYADWLELRFVREPKENIVVAMEEALIKAAVEIDIARMAVKKVFNPSED